MKSRWIVYDQEIKSASQNMEDDRKALAALEKDDNPILRFYSWENISATFGHFIDPAEYFNPKGLEKRKVALARRPTGGGILFHHVDLSFSLLVPQSHPYYGATALDSYRIINGIIKKALERLGISFQPLLQDSAVATQHEKFCMAHPTIYDLVMDGKKIAGGAQRRGRNALLHQASICISNPEEGFYEDVLLPNPALLQAFKNISYPLKLTEKQVSLYKQLLYEELSASAL